MTETPTFGRYSELPLDKMTPAQRAAYDHMVDGPRGRLPSCRARPARSAAS